MRQVYIGTPREARHLSRDLIKLGVDAIGIASVGDTDRHVVYVPDQDAVMVRAWMAARLAKAKDGAA